MRSAAFLKAANHDDSPVIVDLAFQESTPEFDGWIVVDFKTDQEIKKAETQYRAQVAAYVEAIHLATNSPARGFLLVV